MSHDTTSHRTILVIYGTRPEALKLSPVIRALQGHHGVSMVVCSTGQHRELLDAVQECGIAGPDVRLDLMRPDQSPWELVARTVETLGPVIDRTRPDIVVVQGDTATTLAAAMSAVAHGVPVAHVEAGLRTHDLSEPWPEEQIRRIVTRLATWHFAPTTRAGENLAAESVPPTSIHITGNTAIDVLEEHLACEASHHNDPDVFPGSKLVLVTSHRREKSPAHRLAEWNVIAEVTSRHEGLELAILDHPRQDVTTTLDRFLATRIGRTARRIVPGGHCGFVRLLARSEVVITDSGGIQEEAPHLGIPVIVTRRVTERTEGLEAGNAMLAGDDLDALRDSLASLLRDRGLFGKAATPRSIYGDGRAGLRIASILATVPVEPAQRLESPLSAAIDSLNLR